MYVRNSCMYNYPKFYVFCNSTCSGPAVICHWKRKRILYIIWNPFMVCRFLTFKFKTWRKEIAVKLLNNFRIKRENILPFEAESVSYRFKRAAAKIKEKIFLLRKKQEKFSRYYRMQYYFCVCSDVKGLREESGFPHDVNEWKLYTNA